MPGGWAPRRWVRSGRHQDTVTSKLALLGVIEDESMINPRLYDDIKAEISALQSGGAMKNTYASRFKGVYRSKSKTSPWKATIWIDGKLHDL